MIYLLEFTGSLYEFKNSHGNTSIALHTIVKKRPDMMILHRYLFNRCCHKKLYYQFKLNTIIFYFFYDWNIQFTWI